MNFVWPAALWLAACLAPLLAWFYFWTWRSQAEAVRRFIPERLWPQLVRGVSPGRRRLKRFMVGLAFVAALAALARPRWGLAEEESTVRGLDVVVCLDVSRSMLADDAAPTRLAKAKRAAFDLAGVTEGRIGLVAFAGEAFLQCPLTFDFAAFNETVATLDTDSVFTQGTDLGAAIREAASAFSREDTGAKALVIISDGEDHEQDAVDAARAAAALGIKIFSLGVGTTAGSVLRTPDPYGNPVFVKDSEGNAVRSRLEETLLREVASAGGGFYLPLRDRATVEALNRDGLAPLPKTMRHEGRRRDWVERFQWPMGLALLLLAGELLLPESSRRTRLAPPIAP